MGKYPDASSSLKVLDKDEAKRLFRSHDEEGLVHSIWTGVTPYIVGLCNCDHDCWPYREYFEKGCRPAFFCAEYVFHVDWEHCTGCKARMSQCQLGAQFYSPAVSGVYIDPTRCFGCGVCTAACPNDAVSSIVRQEHAQVVGVW